MSAGIGSTSLSIAFTSWWSMNCGWPTRAINSAASAHVLMKSVSFGVSGSMQIVTPRAAMRGSSSWA